MRARTARGLRGATGAARRRAAHHAGEHLGRLWESALADGKLRVGTIRREIERPAR